MPCLEPQKVPPANYRVNSRAERAAESLPLRTAQGAKCWASSGVPGAETEGGISLHLAKCFDLSCKYMGAPLLGYLKLEQMCREVLGQLSHHDSQDNRDSR